MPLTASAGEQTYHNGRIYIGTDDPTCVWYRGQAACSGWNYWAWNHIERWSWSDFGTLLFGFENNNRIRGSWNEWNNVSETVAPFYFEMGGYLTAHATWWSGRPVWALVEART